MNQETLFENFELLAEAPNGVQKLRELILQLAVQGKLVPQDQNNEPASNLLDKIKVRKEQLIQKNIIKKAKPFLPIDKSDIPNILPENWESVRLGDLIISIIGGGTPSKNKTEYWGGNIPWASVKDLRKEKYLEKTIDYITEIGLEKSSTNLIPKGNVIICTRMGLGKIALNRIDVAINQDLKAIELPEELDQDYFYNFYLTQNIVGNGMTVSGIRQSELLNFIVPLPPLKEQKHIVAKVDQLMALCDQMEARQQEKHDNRIRLNNAALDKLLTAPTPGEFAQHWQRICDNFDLLYDAPETVGQLRQAILQLAVQGKLVAQDEGDESAYELLKLITKERENAIRTKVIKKSQSFPSLVEEDLPFDAPSGWIFERFGNLFNFIDYRGKTPEKVESGIRLITAKNIRMGYRRDQPMEFVTEKTYNQRMTRGFPEMGDLLFTTEAPMGNVCLVDLDEKFALAQRTINLHPFSELNSHYLMFAIMSPLIQGMISEKATGMTATGIKAAKLKLIPIPLPPLDEQKRIVAKVDHLMALCDELEAGLVQAQTDGGKLMEAVVHHVLAA